MKGRWEPPRLTKHSRAASAICRHPTVTWWDPPPGAGMLTTRHFWSPPRVTWCDVCFVVQDYSPHPVMAPDMNRGLPPMSTFHRNNATPRTPAINTSDTGDSMEIVSFHGLFLIRLARFCTNTLYLVLFSFSPASGSKRNVSGGSQTGDTLGKALASVRIDHLNPIRCAHIRSLVFKQSDESIKPTPPRAPEV